MDVGNNTAFFANNVSFERNRAPLPGQNKCGAIVERTVHAAGSALQAVAGVFVKGATIIAAGTVYVVSAIAACPIYLLGAVIKLFGDRSLDTHTIKLSFLQAQVENEGQAAELDFTPLNDVIRTERKINCLHLDLQDVNQGGENPLPSSDDLANTLNKLGRNVNSVRLTPCTLQQLNMNVGQLSRRWIASEVPGENNNNAILLIRKEVVESLTIYLDKDTNFYNIPPLIARIAPQVEFQTINFFVIGEINPDFITNIQGLVHVGHMTVSSYADGAVEGKTVKNLKKAMDKDIAALKRRFPEPEAGQAIGVEEGNNNQPPQQVQLEENNAEI